MGKTVDLKNYRTAKARRIGLQPWCDRFAESIDENTCWCHLSNATLHHLAQPGDNATQAFYALIMGCLGLGTPLKFDFLTTAQRMKVMDIHLFLLDQARFEMMRRLNWLHRYPGERYSLLSMVLDFDHIRAECRGKVPELAVTHPDYEHFRRLITREKECFIRRLLPAALAAFDPSP